MTLKYFQHLLLNLAAGGARMPLEDTDEKASLGPTRNVKLGQNRGWGFLPPQCLIPRRPPRTTHSTRVLSILAWPFHTPGLLCFGDRELVPPPATLHLPSTFSKGPEAMAYIYYIVPLTAWYPGSEEGVVSLALFMTQVVGTYSLPAFRISGIAQSEAQ